MEFQYTLDQERRRIVWHITGRMTVEDVLGAYESALTDPDWSADMDQMTIFSSIDLSDMSPDRWQTLINGFVAADKRLGVRPGTRAAIVMDDALQEALMTYYELISEPVTVTEERVFTTTTEAEAWLDTPRDRDTIQNWFTYAVSPVRCLSVRKQYYNYGNVDELESDRGLVWRLHLCGWGKTGLLHGQCG